MDKLLKKLDEEKLGIWPESDSIVILDNTIIIQLGAEVQ